MSVFLFVFHQNKFSKPARQHEKHKNMMKKALIVDTFHLCSLYCLPYIWGSYINIQLIKIVLCFWGIWDNCSLYYYAFKLFSLFDCDIKMLKTYLQVDAKWRKTQLWLKYHDEFKSIILFVLKINKKCSVWLENFFITMMFCRWKSEVISNCTYSNKINKTTRIFGDDPL